ncbi:MAG: hypothetical protein JSS33_12030, partial [Proteobacteria bacterium]|nr:hypothetical protein [Pseudomonadota bacterium]
MPATVAFRDAFALLNLDRGVRDPETLTQHLLDRDQRVAGFGIGRHA